MVARSHFLFMYQEWAWYVYIIECRNGTYYTGCTSDILYRYQQHRTGQGSAYTRRYGVKRLVYIERYISLEQARLRERQLKDWSQAKKRNLINGIWDQVW